MKRSNPFERFTFGGGAKAKRDKDDGAAVHNDDVKQETHTGAVVAAPIKHEPVACAASAEPTTRVKCEHEAQEEDPRLALLKRLMRAREKMTAPIDQFGTHACVAPHAQSDANKRFHILVAALLSSQTNDKITHAAMQRLHEQLRSPNDNEDNEDGNEGLTVAKVRATSETQLDALLTPVGFHRRKAQQLKQIADTLHAQYKDDIPRTYTRLTALPGIGPKIARVILLVAWSEAADGVIVDTHVHRLAGRLGWARTKGSSERTAEATRVALEEWVPREYWTPFSRAVVGFGQTVCTAINPKCASCPLADACPSAFRTATVDKSTKAAAKPKAVSKANAR